jgi:transcriptional regulator with XRE-family HTH domain
MDTFGTWLAAELKYQGWSMSELARRCDVSHATISRIISGERNPSASVCTAIAKAFKMSQEDVLRRAGILDPEPSETASLIEANRLFAQLTDEERRMKIVEMRALIERRRSAELATDTT